MPRGFPAPNPKRSRTARGCRRSAADAGAVRDPSDERRSRRNHRRNRPVRNRGMLRGRSHARRSRNCRRGVGERSPRYWLGDPGGGARGKGLCRVRENERPGFPKHCGKRRSGRERQSQMSGRVRAGNDCARTARATPRLDHSGGSLPNAPGAPLAGEARRGATPGGRSPG